VESPLIRELVATGRVLPGLTRYGTSKFSKPDAAVLEDSLGTLGGVLHAILSQEPLPKGVSRTSAWKLVESLCRQGYVEPLLSTVSRAFESFSETHQLRLRSLLRERQTQQREACTYHDFLVVFRDLTQAKQRLLMLFSHLERTHVALHGLPTSQSISDKGPLSLFDQLGAMLRQKYGANPEVQSEVMAAVMAIVREDRIACGPYLDAVRNLASTATATATEAEAMATADTAKSPAAATSPSMSLLVSVTPMLRYLRLLDCLPTALLQEAANFYRSEGEEALHTTKTVSMESYLKNFEYRLQDERRRLSALSCEAALVEQMLTVLRKELIWRQRPLILDSLPRFLADNSLEDLRRLYSSLLAVNATREFRAAFGAAIRSDLSKLLSPLAPPAGRASGPIAAGSFKLEEAKHVMPSLAAYHQQMKRAISTAFGDDRTLASDLAENLRSALRNLPGTLSEQLLAKYAEAILFSEGGDLPASQGTEASSQRSAASASGNLAASSSSMRPPGNVDGGTALAGLIGIFSQLPAKDAFEAFFKRDLAKRLLKKQQRRWLATSAGVGDLMKSCLPIVESNSLEADFLEMLKDECGSVYVAGLEGCIQDLDNSNLLLQDYWAVHPNAAREGFGVSILTTGRWPYSEGITPSSVIWPEEVRPHMESLSNFYRMRHSGRSIRWTASLGQCVLSGNFVAARKLLVGSTAQGLVLLAFNQSGDWTPETLGAFTGLDVETINRMLRSLSQSSPQVLKKAGDTFSVNLNFMHKLFRVRLPQPSSAATTTADVSETNALEQKLVEDRQMLLDAAIVRMLKAKRRLVQESLEISISTSMPFPVSRSDIEKRISVLIERDFIEMENAVNQSEGTVYLYKS